MVMTSSPPNSAIISPLEPPEVAAVSTRAASTTHTSSSGLGYVQPEDMQVVSAPPITARGVL